MSVLIIGLLFWGVLSLVLLGWLVPLIVGVRRRRSCGRGNVLISVGAVWGVLAAGLVALCIKACCEYKRHSGGETAAFDASAFKGDVATLAFAYGYAGEFEYSHEGASGAANYRGVVSNGLAVVPAGQLRIEDVRLTVTDGCGRVCGMLYGRCAPSNGTFTLTANAKCPVPGAFPLTASIDAERQTGGLSLNFKMLDTAGNRFVWYPEGAGRTPPAFEAVAPDGKCFWRDKFEYG